MGQEVATTRDTASIVEQLGLVFASIRELLGSLAPDDWTRDTDCPGWTVKDHVSHLSGTESRLLGRPEPDHQAPEATHVRNPIGQANENEVDYRRTWPPERVLEEFREVTSARLGQLRSWGPEDFAKESWTPVGPGTVLDFLEIRIFDCWVHEQDVRRAVSKPGHLDSPVAAHSFGRITAAVPYVVGKKVAPPDGTGIVFDITGPVGGRLAVFMEVGRAKAVDRIPEDPAVALRMDLETFNCLGCGRWTAKQALEQDRVQIDGDTALGRRIVDQMNFMI